MNLEEFKKVIWEDYQKRGRGNLPWRRNITPYKILVSEIMLQQTQVNRAISKYQEFMREFPSFRALAKAPTRKVLHVWQGLGYNRRALALKQTAEKVVRDYNGRLPRSEAELVALPGIGPATAASISAYAYNKPAMFIETNIRSIFIHFFFRDQEEISDKDLRPLVEKTIDKKNPREWYWALMDYAVNLKKEFKNPSRRSKHYVRQSKFIGSNRELRGKIIKLLLEYQSISTREILDRIEFPKEKIATALTELEKEGFITQKKRLFRLVH